MAAAAPSSWTDFPRAVAPVVVSLVLEVLAILAVGLRFYSHRLKRVSTAAHDFAILVALIFSTGLVICLILATVLGGLGQHITELSNPTVQLVRFAKIYLAISPIWGVAISGVKISILLLYISIFRRKTFIRCCYAMIALQVIWCIGVILASLLLCQPIQLNWDATAKGHCGSKEGAYLSLHITNLIFDVMVGLLPIPVLWTLQLKLRRKISLSCMFALGIAICIITICRITLINDLMGTDLTYSTTTLCTFMILETLLGAILACLPTLRPAMEKFSTLATSSGSVRRLRGGSTTGKSADHSSIEPNTTTASSTRNYKDFQRLNASMDSTSKLHRTTVTSEHGDLPAGRTDEENIYVVDTWNIEMGRKPSRN